VRAGSQEAETLDRASPLKRACASLSTIARVRRPLHSILSFRRTKSVPLVGLRRSYRPTMPRLCSGMAPSATVCSLTGCCQPLTPPILLGRDQLVHQKPLLGSLCAKAQASRLMGKHQMHSAHLRTRQAQRHRHLQAPSSCCQPLQGSTWSWPPRLNQLLHPGKPASSSPARILPSSHSNLELCTRKDMQHHKSSEDSILDSFAAMTELLPG
jgi:hypothetical protein